MPLVNVLVSAFKALYFIFSFSLLIFPSYFCLFPKLSTKVLFSCKLDPSFLTIGGNPVYRYDECLEMIVLY